MFWQRENSLEVRQETEIRRSIRNQTVSVRTERENIKIFFFLSKGVGSKKPFFLGVEDRKALAWTGEVIQAGRFQNENTTGEKLTF